MRTLLRIYGKYIAVTWLIIFVLLIVNGGILFHMMQDEYDQTIDISIHRSSLNKIEKWIFEENGSFVMAADGEDYLKEQGVSFLLVLDDEGAVVLAWNQPEGFGDHYTAGEIAAFSKWYLQDYPVKVYRGEKGLLVAGFPKDSLWKYNIEMSQKFMESIGGYFRAFLLVNLLVILSLVAYLGYRFYKTMKPLTSGIIGLSENQQVNLSEKGITGTLAEALNRTSRILQTQREKLQQRDAARAEWIAGVSHDVRTPLSLIVGYADELEQLSCLTEQDRRKTELIKEQSMKLGQLVEDLNLTSKLEYQMQPLRVAEFYPAQILRMLTAELLNHHAEDTYEISLQVERELESAKLWGDEKLLARAIRNLLGNCIRHNPTGCKVWIWGGISDTEQRQASRQNIVITVEDDGIGIPLTVRNKLMQDKEDILVQAKRDMAEQNEQDTENVHIMGLRITQQIVQAHHGKMKIKKEGHLIELTLPTVSPKAYFD